MHTIFEGKIFAEICFHEKCLQDSISGGGLQIGGCCLEKELGRVNNGATPSS